MQANSPPLFLLFFFAILSWLTGIISYDKMKKLGKRKNTVNFEPNEGERTLLSSNKGGMRSPSLDLGISPDSTQKELIGILADILIEGFLWQHKYGKENTKQSSDLLPGINKRTS